MTNDDKSARDGLDNELFDLFSAFNEVSASDELKEATIARILDAAGERAGEAQAASIEGGTQDAPSTHGTAPSPASESDIRAIAGKNQAKASHRAKWRAIRVAALAACLALALTGGVAYAVPVSYYEIVQGSTTVTLGVNCFGISVSATSEDTVGRDVIRQAALENIPCDEAINHAIEAMERRDSTEAIEYGPKDGNHERIEPRETDGGPGDSQAEQHPSDQQGAESQPPAIDPPRGAGEADPTNGDPGADHDRAGQDEAAQEPAGATAVGNASDGAYHDSPGTPTMPERR